MNISEINIIIFVICSLIGIIIFISIWFLKASTEYENEINDLNFDKRILKEKLQQKDKEIKKISIPRDMEKLIDGVVNPPNYRYRKLIELLKEIADFRETNRLDYEDKVLVLVPTKLKMKDTFIDLLKDSDD